MIDGQSEPSIAAKYNVSHYPTILFFLPYEKGNPVDYTGSGSAREIAASAEEHLESVDTPQELTLVEEQEDLASL